jgi:ribulose 1,5-bisphosphate synthetase/thiazole synthase
MGESISRRDWIRMVSASGVAAGLGAAMPTSLRADPLGDGSGFAGTIIKDKVTQPTDASAILSGGKIIQPQRELTMLHKTDVLVIGGGTAGVTAAIAARRAGADVTLVERYNHLGGLWTGGLVLIVLGHFVTGQKQVCQGIGEEMLRRLDKLESGIINRIPGKNPTIDAEALKYVMVDMIQEAGVKTFLHCWGVDAIRDGNKVCGAVVESKSGRQAILAKTVIDATGDGDVFAAAGAEYQHCKFNIGLVSRIGQVDQIDASKADSTKKPRRLGSATPVAGVNWVNLLGPEGDGLDVAELSRLEMEHRQFIWKNVESLRATPGYEKIRLLETAPQIGVRVTRLLRGVKTITYQDFKARVRYDDVVAVGGVTNCNQPEWQIPYGALVPKGPVENILAAGRCISTDLRTADYARVIAICWITGHAAGVGAAVAAKDGCLVRDVEVPKVQRILKEQGAYLG